MSAPIVSRLSQKDLINSLTRTHLLLSFLILIFTITSVTRDNFLSIVKYRLFVTKLIVAFIAVANVVYQNYFLPTAGTSKLTGISLKLRCILKNGLLLFCSSIFFHVLAILFGAPLFESSAETFHLGMTMSVTVVLPVICVIGTNTSHWTRMFVFNSPELGIESVVYFSTLSSIVGAWLGAFPIPLDWDRPWQEWPITCVIGTLLGYCVGLIIGVGHLYINYHRIKRIKIT